MFSSLFFGSFAHLAFIQLGVFPATCVRVRRDASESHNALQTIGRDTIEDREQRRNITSRKTRSHEVPRHPKESESPDSLWTHPLVLGIVLGLFLIGPDHLGTLMALSTLTSGLASFKSGFYWGVGHSTGLLLLCPICLALEYLTSKAISRESWEYYGDIFIGITMIVVSMYFIYYEESYLQRREDGTYVATCACHGTPSVQSMPMQVRRSIASTDSSECKPCDLLFTETKSESARMKLEEQSRDSASNQGFGMNYLFGMLQGLCCPLGVTAGTGFMSRVTATASPPMLLGFMVEFILASGVGSGAIAFGWGALTTRGSGTLGRVVYIVTCLMLFAFGVTWLVAQSLGVLHQIDFGHKIHEKLVSNA